MMRRENMCSVAVRNLDGEIAVETKKVTSLREKYKVFDLPFIRGAVVLFESLIIGMKALSFSGKILTKDEEEEMTDKDIAITTVVAFILAGAIFVVLPTQATHFMIGEDADPFWLNTVEGAIRLLLFLAYVAGISLMKDIRRVFMYHGAEHKTIYCYEKDLPLTVENIRVQKRIHPRCGTSFLLLVAIISTVIFAFTGWPDLVTRIVSRLALLPVIAGISYEVLKLLAKSDNIIAKVLVMPGLWLQYLTTREPTDDMLEVAAKALTEVLPKEAAA
ncbi:MAG: DUF1385 domain-containing protein [Selenomonadaceae bacterium]|nr:DUF1385 domain-containing protein [Selenomonadaceae bacterium]